MNLSKRIIDALIGLLAGALLVLWLTPKQESVEDILKAKEKEYKKKIDSVNVVIQHLQVKEQILQKSIDYLRIQKSQAEQQTQQYKSKYERLKNSPVPHYTDHQVDSILSAWYDPR